MASRPLEGGNLLARTRSMIDHGIWKRKPLWLDVVERFPPRREQVYQRTPKRGRAPKLAFPEDELRVSFSRKYEILNSGVARRQEALQLDESRAKPAPSTCDRYIEKLVSSMAQGQSREQGEQDAVTAIRNSGVILRERSVGIHA